MTQEHKSDSGDSPTRDMPTPDHTVIIDVPRELGSYKLSKLLGRGGMGEVWQAFDTNLERDVAVKLMRKELLANEDATRRFFREARAVARLNHPNIVQVYAFGDEKGIYYFVMEMVEGETVSQKLKRVKHMPMDEALHVMLQSIEGLGYANARGIIHRDIKPSNLMLTEDSRVKIADFGLAKMVEHDTQMTAAGTAMGSPNYMSPEQARGEEADHRSDIYALGVSLYQMLCGDLPFTASSPVSVLLKQIQEPLPEHDMITCLSDRAVFNLIKKMTAKAPADRFQTYGELATAMAALLPDGKFKGAHGITSSFPAAQAQAPGHITPGSGVERSAEFSPIPPSPVAERETMEQTAPPIKTPSDGVTPVVSTSSSFPASEHEKLQSRKGLLVAAIAAVAIAALAVLAWWMFGQSGQSSSGQTAEVQPATAGNSSPAVTPAPSPQPTASPAPSPAPSPTPTPNTVATSTPPVALTPVTTTISTQPGTDGMKPVNIAALVTPPITPMPGVQTTITPTPDIRTMMPRGITPSPVAPTPAPAVFILGIEGSQSSDPIPTFTDAAARNPYKQFPAGTEATLITDGPTTIRVIPAGESRPVYVLKKMAHRKP